MGWDTDRFPGVNLELMCCICNGILADPVELPCRHIFCSDCIEKWFKSKKTCPQCRAHSRKRDIKPVAPLLKNIIDKQVIYCDNREDGCSEEIPLELLTSHLSKCPFFRVPCTNQGCNMTVLRRDLIEHELSCPKRPILCTKGCGKAMPVDEYDTHSCVAVLKLEITECHEKSDRLNDRIAVLEQVVNNLSQLVGGREMDQNLNPFLDASDLLTRRTHSASDSAPNQNTSKRITRSNQLPSIESTRTTDSTARNGRRETQAHARVTSASSASRVRARSRSPVRRSSAAVTSVAIVNRLSERISTTLPGSLNGGTMSVHVSSHQREIPSFSTSDTTDTSDFSLSSSSTDSSDLD